MCVCLLMIICMCESIGITVLGFKCESVLVVSGSVGVCDHTSGV